jgi:hypothetical protein
MGHSYQYQFAPPLWEIFHCVLPTDRSNFFIFSPAMFDRIVSCSPSDIVRSMKELHDERLDIHVLSVCSVVCDVQMIEVIRKNLW